MDLKELKQAVAGSPDLLQRCFILNGNTDSNINRVYFIGKICQTLGKNNVESVEFMADGLILVTIKNQELRDHLLARITKVKVDYTRFTVHSVDPCDPVSALVKGTVKGLPQLLARKNTKKLLEEIVRVFPLLKNVRIEYVQWSDSSATMENVLWEGTTSDVVSYRKSNMSDVPINIDMFEGKCDVKTIQPLLDKSTPLPLKIPLMS